MPQPTQKNWGNQTLICKAHLTPPVYKKVEDLTAGDIQQLESYALTLRGAIRTAKSDVMISRRAELRDELNRVIEFLFQFNINLTNLTYNND